MDRRMEGEAMSIILNRGGFAPLLFLYPNYKKVLKIDKKRRYNINVR